MNIAFCMPFFLWLWVYSWLFVWNRESDRSYTPNTLHQSVGKHWQQEGRHVSSIYFIQVFYMCSSPWGKVWSQLDPNARLHFQQHRLSRVLPLLTAWKMFGTKFKCLFGRMGGDVCSFFTPPHALWGGGEGVAPCVFILDSHVFQLCWHALLTPLLLSFIAAPLLACFKSIVPSSHKSLHIWPPLSWGQKMQPLIIYFYRKLHILKKTSGTLQHFVQVLGLILACEQGEWEEF